MTKWWGTVGILVGLCGVLSGCGTTIPVASSPQTGSFRIMQRCPGRYVNPSWDPQQVVEWNNVSFRLRGEATWRPGCVSAPYIVEENATSFRRIGSATWERK